MNECLWCHQKLPLRLTWDWLFSLKPLPQNYICASCLKMFEKTGDKVCPGCGRKQDNMNLCLDCSKWQHDHHLLHNKALFVYQQAAMKEYIEQYKFMGNYQLRRLFQKQIQAAITPYLKKAFTVVVIPVDQETFETRGFNQVCGWLEGIKYQSYFEMKKKYGRQKQSTKTRCQRLATKNPFKYTGPETLKGKKILLVDDIYTTGRTLYYAQEILEEKGAEFVTSLTLAR